MLHLQVDLNRYIYQINLKPSDASKLLNCSSKIWKEILIAWCKFNYHEPKSKKDILNQGIWYNSNLKLSNHFYVNQIASRAGLVNVHQMFELNGLFISFDTYVNRFQSKNFIWYQAFISRFPEEWLLLLQKDHVRIETLNGNEKLQKIKKANPSLSPSKIIYWEILSKLPPQTKRVQWELQLGVEISSMEWKKILTTPASLTQCTKLKAFQYRLTNRILTTNVQRNKWDSTVPFLCTFCNAEPESVVHLLVSCEVVTKVWKLLKKWLNYYCYIEFEISPYVIIFNRYKDSFPLLVNTIILVTKQYIYARKCLNESPNFNNLIKHIAIYRNLERAFAFKNAQYSKYKTKWSIYDVV